MYFHIRISLKSNPSYVETKIDLSEEQLNLRIITPYEQGEPIIINGKTILPNDIERIRVSKSNETARKIIESFLIKDSSSNVIMLESPSYEWRAAEHALDVTDEYIKVHPGYKKTIERKKNIDKKSTLKNKKSTKKIFIVHGKDKLLKNETANFINAIKLRPVILHMEPDEGLTVIEKFVKHSDVQFAIILLTPDDLACPAEEFNKNESDRHYTARARQNVVFELGFFVAKLGRPRVCCIFKEGIELPSDIGGLLYKKYEDSIESIGYSLIKEIQKAGLKPELK
jgi:predicted nucleotide-binding protein